MDFRARPQTLLSPQYSGDVSTTPGKFDINGFIQSLLQGAQGVGNAVPHKAPGTIPAPPPPAAMPNDRLQMQRERQNFQKSIITPRHLGMSGEELTPQNPFTSGFFTPAAERQGAQNLAPQGDFGLLTSPSSLPYSAAFTNTSTDAQHPSIASGYGTASAQYGPGANGGQVAQAPVATPAMTPNDQLAQTQPPASSFDLPASFLGASPSTLGMAPNPNLSVDPTSTIQRGIVKPRPQPVGFRPGYASAF